MFLNGSQYSSIEIATTHGLDDFGVGVRDPLGSRIFSSPRRPDLPIQLPMQWVQGVKRQDREADHSPPTNVEINITWIYTSTTPYVFMA
jgi:hypothetical protein